MLLVIVSAMDIPSRMICGILFDIKYIKKHRILIFTCLATLMGICNIFLPIIEGLIGTFVLWCVTQCLRAAIHSQHPTTLSDLVPPQRLTSALGLLRFFQGVGILAGPSLGGMLLN